MTRPLVKLVRLTKQYSLRAHEVSVLNGIDLSLDPGEFLAVMGTSGSGKSTLLNIIGCLDRPTEGTYFLDGIDVLTAGDDHLSRLRSQCIGFVFQNFNLIPGLTVRENVELPFLYRDDAAAEIDVRVKRAIEQVSLIHRLNHRPAELSGGEMQRVAIARALAVTPKLILADEPTGNLDSRTGDGIMKIFGRLHEQGATIVLVTHDAKVAGCAHRRVVLNDGRIVDQT